MTDPAPNRVRAALVKIDPADGLPTVIPFQYNLDALHRSLQPATVSGEPGGHSETVRFSGPPSEIITLIIELGGLGDLLTPAQNTAAAQTGVYPQLYALETLIYPSLAQIQQATRMLNSGSMEIAPIDAPLVLFVWGNKRVLPVTVQSMEVVEQAFDAQLSPLRALVSLTLRVVSYSDLDPGGADYSRFMQYAEVQKALAANVHAT